MKRSEMLQELANALIEMDHTFTPGVAMDIVDTVLDKAEEMGMLPPVTEVELTEREQRIATNFLAKSKGVKRVNKWDNE